MYNTKLNYTYRTYQKASLVLFRLFGLLLILLSDQSVLHAKTIAGYLPFVCLGGDHERLLERLQAGRLELHHARHLNEIGRLTGDRIVDNRLRVQRLDAVLGAGQVLVVFLDFLAADRFVAVPDEQPGVEIEAGHLLRKRGKSEWEGFFFYYRDIEFNRNGYNNLRVVACPRFHSRDW